jgi:ELWxxDGT repeat protein
MTNLNGLAFFGDGRQTWRSDGTSEGTVPFDIGVGAMVGEWSFDHKGPAHEVVGGNLLYYLGNTPGLYSNLWVTDGTSKGSRLVKFGTSFGEIAAAGNIVFFTSGIRLMRSDGTSAGTWPVASFRNPLDLADEGVVPGLLTGAGNGVYFVTQGTGAGDLYASNGIGVGSVLLFDSQVGSMIGPHTALLPDRSLLFSVDKFFEGKVEIWRSNGTTAGTFRVKTIGASGVWNLGQEGVVIGNYWYFAARGESGDLELWRSNGTGIGTTRFAVIPGAEGSWRNGVASVVDGTIYFSVSVSGSNRLWKTDGTQAGTMEVDDRVRDIGGIVLSGEDLFVSGKRSDVGGELFKLDNVRPAPFAITQGPVSQTVELGGRLSLSASVTSAVGLKFKWRKDGIAIPGATGLRFTTDKVNEFDEGRYDLLIRQGNYEVLTNAAEVEVGDPMRLLVVQQPQSKLAAVGGSAEFEVESVGLWPVTAQWYKESKAIPGATGLTLTLPNVSMADAGGYKVVLKNGLGSVTSATAELGVVDTSDRFVAAKLNSPLTIKAPVAGRGMQFVWDEGDIGPSLTIPRVEEQTSRPYYQCRCIVRMGNQELQTGLQIVEVASIPLVTGAALLPDWSISEWVNWPVSALLSQSNLAGAAWNAPTSFSVSGLPRGLRYDPVTMRIVGRPIAGGGGSVTIKIKATNAAGTSAEVSVVIDLIALPVLAAGEYRGLVDRNGAINGLLGNGLQVTITDLGGISGRLAQGTVALGFQGVLNTTAGLSQATANISIPRRGAVPLQLNLNLNGATGVLTGSVTDGAATANATLERCPWSKTSLTTDYAAAYTGVFQLQAGQVGDVDYPQGEATLTATVSTAGAVSGAVRFADGVRTTFSVLLGGQGECALYIPGYSNTGSLRGWGTIASGTKLLDGTATFYKAAQVATSTTRSYKGGVPEHTLTLVGGEWVKPTAGVLLLGVTDSGAAVAADNAKVTFTSGGINSSGLSVSGAFVEQVRVKAPTSSLVVPSGAGNPGKLKLALNATTGEISGEFSTSDENPLISGKMIPRKAPFFGVVVQRLNQGRGRFNLAKLPAAAPEETNPAKTKILSGLVKLEVLP